MAEKEKHLCKWKKDDLEKGFDDLVAIVKKPKFVCMKCGRAASSKKWICKPAAIKG